MEIRIKKESFIDESDFIDAMFTPTKKGTEIELAKLFANGIEKQLTIASRALELTDRKISIDEFMEIINTLYDISLSETDYYNVFSLVYNKKYCIGLIDTYMVRNSKKYSGYILVSNEDVEIRFKVAHSEDFKHNPNNRYTIEELRQLIKDRKIIILDEFESELTIPEKLHERYEKFPVHRNYKSMSEDNPFYPYIIAYIRKTISNDKIKNDVHEHLVNLKLSINEALSSINTSLVNECQKQIDKKDILTRLEVLISESRKVAQTTGSRINFEILEKPYPPLVITEETIDNIRKHPELYIGCPVRVFMGKVYTNEEYERRVEEVLNRPLPGDVKKRTRRKKSRRKKNPNKK